MARRKVRHYESVDVVRDKINTYFIEHYDDVIKYLLAAVDCETVEQLAEEERHCRFGLDCGWVWVYTNDNEQNREWELDNGRWGAKVTRIRCPFECQSTTVKQIQIDKALEDLHMKPQYFSGVTLD